MTPRMHSKRVQSIAALAGYVQRNDTSSPRRMFAVCAGILAGSMLMAALALVHHLIPMGALVLEALPVLFAVVVYDVVHTCSGRPQTYCQELELELSSFQALDANALHIFRGQVSRKYFPPGVIEAWVDAEIRASKQMYGETLTV